MEYQKRLGHLRSEALLRAMALEEETEVRSSLSESWLFPTLFALPVSAEEAGGEGVLEQLHRMNRGR